MQNYRSLNIAYSYFGAWYYGNDLSVLPRKLSGVDPLADKYPSMSPYMYTAGNPVAKIDPNGLENVVVVGNQGKTPESDNNRNDNKRHFLEAGLNKAKKLKNDKEETTMIVYEGNYTDEQLDYYEKQAKKNDINFIRVNDDADIADYVNKKSISSVSTSARDKDPITDFAYFGHGGPDKLYIGYNTIWDFAERLSASSFNKEAFDKNANIYLESCRSGLGNLYSTFKKYTNGTIQGYNVRLQWGESYTPTYHTGIGIYFPWPKDPNDPHNIIPKNQRVRRERGKR
jgi:hypothetical protein